MPMNFDEKTKAWLLLVTLIVGSGAAVTITTYLGGAKLWISILAGIGTGATNVYHALSDSPQKDKTP